MKENVHFSHFWVLFLKKSDFFSATWQGGFIVRYVWKIQVGKNLTIFEGCYFPWFYWFDRVFGKSRQRFSNRTQAFSILLNWEQYHLLHIVLTVYTLEEVRRWQQAFVGFQNKSFRTKIFNLLTSEKAIERCS